VIQRWKKGTALPLHSLVNAIDKKLFVQRKNTYIIRRKNPSNKCEVRENQDESKIKTGVRVVFQNFKVAQSQKSPYSLSEFQGGTDTIESKDRG